MPENNQPDPRNLWRTITDPSTGQVTITNPDDTEKQECPKATDHPSTTLSTPHTRDEEGADGPGTVGRRPAPPGMGTGHGRPRCDRTNS